VELKIAACEADAHAVQEFWFAVMSRFVYFHRSLVVRGNLSSEHGEREGEAGCPRAGVAGIDVSN